MTYHWLMKLLKKDIISIEQLKYGLTFGGDIFMAVSERIKAEAQRTIAGIQEFYRDLGEDAGSKEEMEHRIERVEAVMEGCNGLTQEEKIQKTAENVFELTCAQERLFDSVRRDFKKAQDETRGEFMALRKEIKDGLKEVTTKIEESCVDQPLSKPAKGKFFPWYLRIVSEHPGWTYVTVISILIILLVSGHWESIEKIIPDGDSLSGKSQDSSEVSKPKLNENKQDWSENGRS